MTRPAVAMALIALVLIVLFYSVGGVVSLAPDLRQAMKVVGP